MNRTILQQRTWISARIVIAKFWKRGHPTKLEVPLSKEGCRDWHGTLTHAVAITYSHAEEGEITFALPSLERSSFSFSAFADLFFGLDFHRLISDCVWCLII